MDKENKVSVFESLDVEAVQELVLYLGYDYDRMSESGQEIYNLLCRHLHVPEIVILPPKEERH
jgi:hypothetical protein